MGLLPENSLLPVTSNRNMLAQALKARNTTPRNQLTGQGLLDTAAIGLSPVPVIGDALGLAADASRYINDPSSRTPLNFGLTALGALPFVPPAAAIFAGPLAKTAKLDQKAIAEGMEKAGRSRDDIWKETGWFKGPEGKWKFEIDDSGARPTMTANKIAGQQENHRVYAGSALKHDNLYSAYPETQTYGIRYENGNPGGSWDVENKMVRLTGPKLKEMSVPKTDVVLHELQHGIQDLEGFAKGGSPSQFANSASVALDPSVVNSAIDIAEKSKQWGIPIDEIQKKPPKFMAGINPMAWQLAKARGNDIDGLYKELDFARNAADPNDAYRRLAGEAEARAVQSRMNMSPQQRQQTPPWQSYDVPWEQLIIK